MVNSDKILKSLDEMEGLKLKFYIDLGMNIGNGHGG